MVTGLNIFRDYFADDTDKYALHMILTTQNWMS